MSQFDDAERAIQHLKRSTLLSGVSEEDLRRVRPAPEIVRLSAGQTLIHQGDSDYDYYVLIAGRLAVFVRDPQGAIVARGRVMPGEGVGEMALLMNEPRTATVIARLDCELVRFPQKGFLNLVDSNPGAAMAVARLTMRRLKEQYTKLQRKQAYQTIAVVPLTPGIDSIALARDLAGQLTPWGSSASVAPRVSASNPGAGPDFEQAMRLEKIESRNQFTIFAATGADAWSRHCVQRSDLVLLAAEAGAQVPSNLVSAELLKGFDPDLLGRVDLLMVHGSEWNRSCETRNWMLRTNPVEQLHIRTGSHPDLAHLARIVAGAANNMVLSGGGAKSFAEFGVLRAFIEAGVPIDHVGGASMGAFVAAVYCYGGDFEDLIWRAAEEFRRRRPARDHTLPLLSLLTGKRLEAIALAICGTWRIEDLPLGFFCVSSDLGEAEQVIHSDGMVCTGLRASCALPGIGPPLLIDGHVLVDGGVLNNLPIDVMRKRFGGHLIAVDVTAYSPIRYSAAYDRRCPSGFEILWNKINPFTKTEPIPGIMEILFRAATLSSQLRARELRDTAELLITPAVQRYEVTDFNRFQELVNTGYSHTMDVLEEAEKNPELKSKLWPRAGAGELTHETV